MEILISVICPVLNEDQNIQELIDFFVSSEPSEKELILIDGGSKDRTVEIIEANITKYSNIKLLHNPKKIVPCALNLAIPICKGSYIIRLDGHTRYADDYFITILETFSKTNAGIVGGPTRTQHKDVVQEAIAFAISHSVGIGGSKVHDELYEGYSDSVTFGAWRKEIFEIAGRFDERLVRNQDDEFHYRAKSKGIKIYQSAAIKLYYSPRSSFSSLFKQYHQYGFYKPLVLNKIRSEIKLRHLIPAIFVLYFISSLFITFYSLYYLIPIVAYVLVIGFVSFHNSKSLSVQMRILMAFPCIHIGYGSGFLAGLINLTREK